MSDPSELVCPCCGRASVPGFTPSEETMLRNLALADAPLPKEAVMKGVYFDEGSFLVLLNRFRKRLRSIGYSVTNSERGRGHIGMYRLEAMGRTLREAR